MGGLRVFSNLVFVNSDCGFLDFSVQCILYGFSGFAKEVTPCSRAKTAIPRDNLYSVLPFLLEEWMTRLVCLADVIRVVSTVSQISPDWDNILGTLTFDLLDRKERFRSFVSEVFISVFGFRRNLVAVLRDFLRGFSVSIRPLRPPHKCDVIYLCPCVFFESFSDPCHKPEGSWPLGTRMV